MEKTERSLEAPEVEWPEEARRMVNELRAQQIELSMQNEEIRRVRAELERERARYFDLYDLAPVGYCTLNEKGLILEANLTAASLLGVVRSELVKQPITRFICTEDQDRFYRRYGQLRDFEPKNTRQSGDARVFELRMVKKNGAPMWARLEAIAAQDVDGAPVCRIVMSDVTERKRGEEALRKSEEQYRLMVDNSSDWIYLINREGRFQYASPSSKRVTGYRADEFINNPKLLMDILHPDDRKLMKSHHQLVRKEIKVHRLDLRITTRKGELRWLSHSCRPVHDEQGRYVGRSVTNRDITGRKRAEAERERLLLAIEQAGDMIVITDCQGAIEYVNPAFETVTGYHCEEIIGKNPRILKSGEQDEDFYRTLWETISSGRTFQGRMVNRRKDGTLFTEEATISPVRDASGRTVNYVAVKHDITENLQLTARLLQAQKMESVGRLAGGVAHDYNNMLSVILGFSGLAMDKVDPADPLHDDLREITNAARRATEITRQLLAFARKQTIAPRELDLNTAVEGMLKMLRRLIGEDISLSWTPKANLWPVKIDPSQLDQILANLCVNARDAITDVGKIIIETQAATFDEVYCKEHPGFLRGDFVMLAVSDDGCGIDRKDLEKIFEPFFTTKELGRGTGLGLTTVYGIVKQNNGLINVYSEPGKGTTFKIYLPRHQGGTASAMEEKEGPIPQGKGEMILVVEDDKPILKLADRILQGVGYTVLTANSAEEALDLAKRYADPLHLLLTDVVMPEMNGRELANQIQSLCPNLKTLFMSGYTADVIGRRGVLDEGIHFIQKPFSKQALAAAVRKVLEA